MPFKDEFANLRERLSDLAARVEEGARDSAKRGVGNGRSRLESALWTLRDLFTRDVTREGLKDLVKRDPRDIFRFYTHEIDFKSLQPLPWFKRFPIAAWRVFVATAYRMSPPRRIAFALAILAFVVGGSKILLRALQFQDRTAGAGWWLICIATLTLLLLMELRDKINLKSDLEIAREIQFGLVPSQPFHNDGTTIYGFMRPANTVGGDYYDMIDLGDHRIAVVIGDVAGKGIPAALLMALLQASVHTLITAGFRGAVLVEKLNAYLCAAIPSNSLVTLFYAELDTSTGDFRYINAGHNSPFLVRSSPAIERLQSTGMALGILKESSFDAMDARLGSGDRLLLFTDGITEAFNEADEEYGEERMMRFIQAHIESGQEEFIAGLIGDVLKFCGEARPGDDMTLLLISRI
jgi:hypothetical protein